MIYEYLMCISMLQKEKIASITITRKDSDGVIITDAVVCAGEEITPPLGDGAYVARYSIS